MMPRPRTNSLFCLDALPLRLLYLFLRYWGNSGPLGSERLAVAAAAADRLALLVFGQFRFAAEHDAASLGAVASFRRARDPVSRRPRVLDLLKFTENNLDPLVSSKTYSSTE